MATELNVGQQSLVELLRKYADDIERGRVVYKAETNQQFATQLGLDQILYKVGETVDIHLELGIR